MKAYIAVAASCAAVLTAAAAPAAELTFLYTSASGSTSWTQSSTPSVLFHGLGSYTDVIVHNGTETTGGVTQTFSDLYFRNSVNSGGFFVQNGPSPIVNDHGPQIYSGSEANPVFAAGVYTLDNGSLTVTDAVPEPAAWSMMLFGVAGLGAMARASRRRRVAA